MNQRGNYTDSPLLSKYFSKDFQKIESRRCITFIIPCQDADNCTKRDTTNCVVNTQLLTQRLKAGTSLLDFATQIAQIARKKLNATILRNRKKKKKMPVKWFRFEASVRFPTKFVAFSNHWIAVSRVITLARGPNETESSDFPAVFSRSRRIRREKTEVDPGNGWAATGHIIDPSIVDA